MSGFGQPAQGFFGQSQGAPGGFAGFFQPNAQPQSVGNQGQNKPQGGGNQFKQNQKQNWQGQKQQNSNAQGPSKPQGNQWQQAPARGGYGRGRGLPNQQTQGSGFQSQQQPQSNQGQYQRGRGGGIRGNDRGNNRGRGYSDRGRGSTRGGNSYQRGGHQQHPSNQQQSYSQPPPSKPVPAFLQQTNHGMTSINLMPQKQSHSLSLTKTGSNSQQQLGSMFNKGGYVGMNQTQSDQSMMSMSPKHPSTSPVNKGGYGQTQQAKQTPYQQKPSQKQSYQPKGADQKSKGQSKKEDEADDYDDEGEDDYYDDEYYDEEYDQEDEKEDNKKKQALAAPKGPPKILTIPGKDPIPLKTAPGKKPCLYFQSDSCKWGSKCKDLHVKDESIKKQLCRFFLTGTCDKGDKCINLHDESKAQEVLKEMQNLNAQYLTLDKQQAKHAPNPLQSLLSTAQSYQQPQNQDGEMTEEQKQAQERMQKVIADKNKGKNLLDLIKKPTGAQNQQVQEESKIQQVPKKPLAKKTLQPSKPTQAPSALVSKPPKPPTQMMKAPQSVPQPNVSPKEIQAKQAHYLSLFNKYRTDSHMRSEFPQAQLLTMCSDAELHHRTVVELNSANNFELDRNETNFETLAIKAFTRSAADKNMNDPVNIRHPLTLFTIVEYLRDCIVDQDKLPQGQSTYKYNNKVKQEHEFLDVYSFARDRGRGISQDIIILNELTNLNCIRSLEQLTRFLICAYQDGFLNPSFDMYQNSKLLTGNLGSLLKCYQAVKEDKTLSQQDKEHILENEAEMTSYLIIASAQDTFLAQNYIINIDTSYYSDKGQFLLKQAIKIHSAKALDNLPQFYKLMKQTNYLFACLMTYFVNELRANALNKFVRAFNKAELQYDFVQKALCFADREDTINFIEACGFTDLKEDSFASGSRAPDDDWGPSFKKYRQRCQLEILTQLKDTNSRGFFMATGISFENFKEQEERRLEALEKQRLLDDQRKKILARLEAQRRAEAEAQRIAQEEKDRLDEEERQRLANEAKAQLEKDEKKRTLEKKLKSIKDQIKDLKSKKKRNKKKAKELGKESMVFQILKRSVFKCKEFTKVYFKQWKETSQKLRIKKDLVRQRNSIYGEIRDLRQQKVNLQQRQQVNFDSLMRIDGDLSILQPFKFSTWASKQITMQQGSLNVLLLSSDIQPQRIQNQDYEYLQYVDSISSMVSLLSDHEKTLFSQVDEKEFISYQKEVSNDLAYSFRYKSLKHNEKVSVLGTSLLMFIVKEDNLYQDINRILKDSLHNLCDWTQMKVFIVVHSNHRRLQQEINKDIELLHYLRASETLGEIETSIFYLPRPTEHSFIHTSFIDESLATTLFSVMQQSLQQSLSTAVTQRSGQMPTLYTFREVVKYELDNMIQGLKVLEETKDAGSFEQMYLSYLDVMRDKTRVDLEPLMNMNEIQVLNFWILALKQLLEPLKQALKAIAHRLMLESTDQSQYNNLRDNLQTSINALEWILYLPLLNYPKDLPQDKVRGHHLGYLVRTQIEQLFKSKLTQDQVEKQLTFIGVYKSTSCLIENQRFYRGSLVFKTILDNVLEHLITDDLKIPIYDDLVEPLQSLTLEELNFRDLKADLTRQKEENQDLTEIIISRFPLDFTEKQPPLDFLVNQGRKLKFYIPNEELSLYDDYFKEFKNEFQKDVDLSKYYYDQRLKLYSGIQDINNFMAQRLEDADNYLYTESNDLVSMVLPHTGIKRTFSERLQEMEEQEMNGVKRMKTEEFEEQVQEALAFITRESTVVTEVEENSREYMEEIRRIVA